MPTSRRASLGRHYTDLVLVAVVALCTQENDVIHAGYLALALLFFRRRDALRAERNRCAPLSTLTWSEALHQLFVGPARYAAAKQLSSASRFEGCTNE